MTPSPPLARPAWKWPRLRARPALALFGFCLLLGLWMGLTLCLTILTEGGEVPGARPFLWEVTGALGIWAVLPILYTAVLNAPGPRVGWGRFLGIHAGAFLLFTGLHTALMVGTRNLLYPLLGWGAYDAGELAFRIPMEAQKDVISYTVTATLWSLFQTWKERQARALREAALEGELRAAQLQALTGQLHPHFLFNALNTVSAVMYEDLARTDRLLSDLGGLLRASLERREPTWTLAEERTQAARFVALLAARFGERVTVRWEVAPGLDGAQVPCFALQALVENAVKHNQDRTEPLEVRIRALEDGGGWRLEVEDTGRGFGARSPASGPGVGLAHLERILALLHAGRARLERGHGPEGGARVSPSGPWPRSSRARPRRRRARVAVAAPGGHDMTRFQVLVADDEAPARAKVKRLLAEDARFVLAGEATDGTQTLRQVGALRPDLLVLDVQMPGLTGFEVLEALGPEHCPAVIFSTAYDAFALAAFEAQAVDYLLKPYDAERFCRALDKAHAVLRGGMPDTARLQALLTELGRAPAGRPLERLVVKVGEAWVPLPLADVWRLSAEDKYVRLYTGQGEHLVRQTLRALEERLDASRFVRVHRGDIVNLDAVARLEPWSHGDGILVLKDGSSVVLSRTWREAFLQKWGLEG